MFPSSDVWRGAVFGAVIGATITLLCVKMWDNQQTAERERRVKKKTAQENDERF